MKIVVNGREELSRFYKDRLMMLQNVNLNHMKEWNKKYYNTPFTADTVVCEGISNDHEKEVFEEHLLYARVAGTSLRVGEHYIEYGTMVK